jgi:hypothetical protein
MVEFEMIPNKSLNRTPGTVLASVDRTVAGAGYFNR